MLSVFSLILLNACEKPHPGDGNAPSHKNLTVYNPPWGYGTETSIDWNTDDDADYKVKVKVQTLDANGNATLYYHHTFQQNVDANGSTSYDYSINVPSGNAAYVIQIDLLYLDCIWQNTFCTGVNPSSIKEFFMQQTYNTQGTPNSNHVFHFGASDQIDEDCCN